jgi:hypothetical protein
MDQMRKSKVKKKKKRLKDREDNSQTLTRFTLPVEFTSIFNFLTPPKNKFRKSEKRTSKKVRRRKYFITPPQVSFLYQCRMGTCAVRRGGF